MDKKILSLPAGQLSVDYIPPRLVEAKQGWYFVFYQRNPDTKALERHRQSFNLGRIRKIKTRRERAKEVEAHVAELMKFGYPCVKGLVVYDLQVYIALLRQETEMTQPFLAERPLSEVLAETCNIACQGLRPDTVRTYKSRTKLLLEWLKKKKWEDWPVSQFKVQHAQAYMDEVRVRVNNNTFNNYRRELAILFNAMKKRGFITENPFSQISSVSKVKKKRRAFEPHEARVVLTEAYKRDYWLFLLMLLHCFQLFRKTECLRLRFRNLNLKEGYISLSEDDSKNHNADTVAIPDDAIPFFLDNRFGAWPGHYYIFGADHRPHATIPAGSNTYMELHRNMLIDLYEEDLLEDMTGLSLYSWKDTGMTMLAEILPPMKLKDHARHSTLDTTLRYYHGKTMVQEVKAAKFSLLEGLSED